MARNHFPRPSSHATLPRQESEAIAGLSVDQKAIANASLLIREVGNVSDLEVVRFAWRTILSPIGEAQSLAGNGSPAKGDRQIDVPDHPCLA